jgi:hypothetical protein
MRTWQRGNNVLTDCVAATPFATSSLKRRPPSRLHRLMPNLGAVSGAMGPRPANEKRSAATGRRGDTRATSNPGHGAAQPPDAE